VKQLIEVYERDDPAAVIAFQNVERSETYRYGIAKLSETEPHRMESIVEKPAPEDAPSTLAQIGRFVFSAEVIDILEQIDIASGNELYLTDAIAVLCRDQPVLVHVIEGQWYTTGDPLRYLMTNVAYALEHPEIGASFAQFLRSLDLSDK
jgi:UTP--glucose-1-phosphate uridylyltransferase